MSALAAYLYIAGCMASLQYVDLLKSKPGATFGVYAYVLGWPIVIPAIWLLALIEAVRK